LPTVDLAAPPLSAPAPAPAPRPGGAEIHAERPFRSASACTEIVLINRNLPEDAFEIGSAAVLANHHCD
jgi:hypothetical protein